MTEWHRPHTPHRPKLVCHKVQCLPGQSWWHPLLLQQSSGALWLWSQCRQHLPVLRWELARIDQADFASNFDLHLWNRELRFSGICIYIYVCVKISTYMYYLIHSYTFHWKFTHYESADSKWFIVCRSQIRRINKHWDPLRPFQFFFRGEEGLCHRDQRCWQSSTGLVWCHCNNSDMTWWPVDVCWFHCFQELITWHSLVAAPQSAPCICKRGEWTGQCTSAAQTIPS